MSGLLTLLSKQHDAKFYNAIFINYYQYIIMYYIHYTHNNNIIIY